MERTEENPVIERERCCRPSCPVSYSRHGVGRARGAAPPRGRGSSENRRRCKVGSRFLRFLVIARSRRLAIGLGPLFLSLLTAGLPAGYHFLRRVGRLQRLERRRLCRCPPSPWAGLSCEDHRYPVMRFNAHFCSHRGDRCGARNQFVCRLIANDGDRDLPPRFDPARSIRVQDAIQRCLPSR